MFGLDMQLIAIVTLAAGAILCLGSASAALWRRRDPAWRRVNEMGQEGTPQPFLNPFAVLKQAIPGCSASLQNRPSPKSHGKSGS